MRKLTVLGVAAILVLGVAAQASAAVKITKIAYKSSSLNGEYVVIKNTGTATVTMSGWTLRDTSSHVYKFPIFKIKPGKTVTVHTGKGPNTWNNLYWGSGYYIWNDDGDTASLRRKDGSIASKCSYTGGGSYKIC